MRKALLLVFIALTIVLGFGAPLQALTPGEEYTIIIQKVTSTGTVEEYTRTTGTADVNGKLAFSLTSLPTHPGTNFIVFIIQDSTENVVRKGFVPAPPAGSTNLVGINSLSTVQTDAVLAAMELADLQRFSPAISEDVFQVLSLKIGLSGPI